ncbi:MAG: hypothetical protein ACYTX0_62285, partial [Nostoc sp.]
TPTPEVVVIYFLEVPNLVVELSFLIEIFIICYRIRVNSQKLFSDSLYKFGNSMVLVRMSDIL